MLSQIPRNLRNGVAAGGFIGSSIQRLVIEVRKILNVRQVHKAFEMVGTGGQRQR